ncbi:MAG: DUF2188 domain-containing protein [Sinimarinibacterium sp.]|jgi:hypothetical protein
MHHYHLRLLGDHWALLEEGAAVATKTFWTKKEGVSYSLCFIGHYGGSLAIHRVNGSLQEERTCPGGLEPIRIAA